jgi:AhpD family alkylhydroperoxidase
MADETDVYPHATPQIAEMRERLAPAAAAAAAQAFHAFGKAVFAEGTLSTKTKQLIAVAVAHVTQCPYCIRGHTEPRRARRDTGRDHGSDLGRRRDARRRCLRARDGGPR